MKNKILITIAIAFILIGAIIFTVVMNINDWNFKIMDITKYKTKIHTIDEPFTNISINIDTADIMFVKSENQNCKVECFEPEKMGYTVFVKNNTLNIDINDTRKWYDYISFFSFSTPKITLQLPQDNYASLLIKSSTGDIQIPKDFSFDNVEIKASTGNVDYKAAAVDDLKIKLSTGHINIENISANNIDLTVSTGKVNLTNVKCESLISNGNTGDMKLTNVIAAKDFNITRSTGDIKFDNCDAKELYITTNTGDVSGTLLTDKVFICKTDTGSISVPKTTTGGKCEITTDTGDIKIKIGK